MTDANQNVQNPAPALSSKQIFGRPKKISVAIRLEVFEASFYNSPKSILVPQPTWPLGAFAGSISETGASGSKCQNDGQGKILRGRS